MVGEYARWIAGFDDETSFAVKIGTKKDLDLGIIIVPLSSALRTEEAHREARSSPFYKLRVSNIGRRVDEMERAIRRGRPLNSWKVG